jgi:antitoxin component YwqK of YwqJK toxin-antitoxin module
MSTTVLDSDYNSDSDYDSDSDSSYDTYISHDTDSSCDSSWAHQSSYDDEFDVICEVDADGKLHGLYEQKDDYGTVRTRCNYIHGRIEGLYQEWHSNRRLSLECTYEKGQRNGFCYKWHRNRALAERSFYVDGFERGVAYYWNRAGMLVRQENNDYAKNIMDRQTWNDYGILTGIKYNTNRRSVLGIWLSWYENGMLRDRLSYKAGELNGHKIAWKKDGSIEKKEYIHPYAYKPYYGEDIKIVDVEL